MNANPSDLELGSVDHRDNTEIAHVEFIDKLSAAAAAQAKDKRHKERVNAPLHNRLSKKC